MIDPTPIPSAPADRPTDQPTDQPSPSGQARNLRVALAHDWLVARRGGELVLDAIARTLLQDQHTISMLYAMFDANIPITPTIDQLPKSVSSLSSYPPPLRRWLLFRYPSAVKHLSSQLARDTTAQPIDLLISTHSAAIKAISPPSAIPHICYCHTPARYLWSQTSAYSSPGFKGSLRSLGLAAFAPSLRKWDKAAADNVTCFIANSAHTAGQIQQHYQRQSTIIHPPVRTDFFTLPDPTQHRTESLLLVSALEPYKRVDLAIDAAILCNRPLIIVGSGSHESTLRKHAQAAQKKHNTKDLITFTGQLTDEQLKAHYQTAGAFLFPQIEDFGITAVEAQSSGCPVIARKAGGALDTVIDQSTGSFFGNATNEPDPESIAQAINQAPSDSNTAQRCRDNAIQFSEDVFSEKLRACISSVL